MNRGDFFAILRRELRVLPEEEMQNALVYHTEYFDEAGIENERRVIDELGDPAAIAKQIIADYREKNPLFIPTVKQRSNTWLWVLLIIFGLPIGLPLAIVLAAVAFTLIISLGAVLFSFWLVAFLFCIIGAAMFFASFTLLPVTAAGTMFVGGSGIALAGAGILFGILAFLLTVGFGKLLSKLFSLFTQRKKRGAIQ